MLIIFHLKAFSLCKQFLLTAFFSVHTLKVENSVSSSAASTFLRISLNMVYHKDQSYECVIFRVCINDLSEKVTPLTTSSLMTVSSTALSPLQLSKHPFRRTLWSWSNWRVNWTFRIFTLTSTTHCSSPKAEHLSHTRTLLWLQPPKLNSNPN